MFQLEQKVQIVWGPAGKPTGVPVDIETWEQILDALEDAEDIAVAREALAALDAAGGGLRKAGYISWDQARAELEQRDVAKEQAERSAPALGAPASGARHHVEKMRRSCYNTDDLR